MRTTQIQLLLTCVLTASPVTVAAAEPVTYLGRVETVTTDPRGRISRAPVVVVRTTAAGEHARAEVIEGGQEWKPGMFVVTRDGGRRVALADPKRRTFQEFSPATLDLEAAEAHGKMRLEVRQAGVQVRDLGPGEPMFGGPTRRFRVSREIDATLRVLFLKPTLRVRETIDYWFAERFGNTANPAAAMLLALSSILPGIDPTFRANHRAAVDQLPGLNPIRVVQTSDSTDDKGRVTRSVTTLQIETPIAASASPASLALPADFRRASR